MAEKTVQIDGQDFNIRSLKWGEIRKLKEMGFSPGDADVTADNEPAIEATLGFVGIKQDKIDELEVNTVFELFKAIFELTYVSGDESKNS
jgi:hypothetical protein